MEKKGFNKTGKSPVMTVLENDKGFKTPSSSQAQKTEDKKTPVITTKSK